MSQFMSNPTGGGFGNTMDPLSNIARLEERKREMARLEAEFAAARANARARRDAKAAENRPASVEAPPATPPTAPTAATTPNASTAASTGSAPSDYDTLRKAARERHGSEIGRMNEFATSGGYVPPLASKRAGQRLDNELRRIAAIEAQDKQRAAVREKMIQRLNERQAAQAARRAQIAAQRKIENTDISDSAIDRARNLTQTTQGVNYAAADQAGNRAYLDRLLAQGYGDKPSPSAPLIEAAKRTPTAALSNLAGIYGNTPLVPEAQPPKAPAALYGNEPLSPAASDPDFVGPPIPSPAAPLVRQPVTTDSQSFIPEDPSGLDLIRQLSALTARPTQASPRDTRTAGQKFVDAARRQPEEVVQYDQNLPIINESIRRNQEAQAEKLQDDRARAYGVRKSPIDETALAQMRDQVAQRRQSDSLVDQRSAAPQPPAMLSRRDLADTFNVPGPGVDNTLAQPTPAPAPVDEGFVGPPLPFLREPQRPLNELLAELDPAQRAAVEEQLRLREMLSSLGTVPSAPARQAATDEQALAQMRQAVANRNMSDSLFDQRSSGAGARPALNLQNASLNPVIGRSAEDLRRIEEYVRMSRLLQEQP
jgi:hypothetical protein